MYESQNNHKIFLDYIDKTQTLEGGCKFELPREPSSCTFQSDYTHHFADKCNRDSLRTLKGSLRVGMKCSLGLSLNGGVGKHFVAICANKEAVYRECTISSQTEINALIAGFWAIQLPIFIYNICLLCKKKKIRANA